MTPAIILGVDPGGSGAFAALNATTGQLIWVEDMPTIDKAVQAPLVADLLNGETIAAAYVEELHAASPMGPSAAFRMGQHHGVVLGVLGALNAPLHRIRPTIWKKAMKVSADKATSRRLAIELWPEHAGWFARVKDTDRAEAALIARYGWLERER